jgi:DNA-binding response OmpR family regulator
MTAPTRRLLLIDDEPQMRTFLFRVAQDCGYEVRLTDNAAGFKEACASWSPDIVILDLVMPQVDGIELLRFLAEKASKTRILIISGFDPKVLDAAYRLGAAHGLSMIGALSKPVRVAELRAILSPASDG